MQLKLFVNNSAANTINKSLTNEQTFDILLRGDFDIIRPKIRLVMPTGISALTFNYATISDLNRNYFIDSVESINSKVWAFNLSCDVIETYKSQILASDAKVKRNIKTGDYISSNVATVATDENATISTFDFNKQFEGSPELILSTVGNSGQES